MQIVAVVLPLVGDLIKIAADAYNNAQQAEAELLAKLKATLSDAIGRVDSALGAIDKARADADAKIAAGYVEPPAMAMPPSKPGYTP